MAVSLSVNGVAYSFPEPNDTAWGQNVTDWATAVSTTTLQRTGGAFTLTAEVDWGASHGTKGIYWKSRTANPAAAGAVRLARADTVSWRNQANGGDLALGVDDSDRLTFNGGLVQSAITVSDTSTIDLTLSGVDVSGAIVAGSITNSHVNASAGIALTKLAALTAGRVAVTDGSGFIVSSGNAAMAGNLDLDGNDILLNGAGTTVLDDAGGGAGATAGAGAGNILARVADATADRIRVLDTGSVEIQSVDGGAGSGPFLRTYRNSATPAASDNIGGLSMIGKDSAGNDQLYGGIYGVITDATSTSEDSTVNVNVTVAGADTNVAKFNGTGLNIPVQTASRAAAFDSNKDLVAATTTLAELNFVSGVTSAIQTQLNTISSGSGMALLQTYSPSSSASVDITSQISSTYDKYLITYDLRPATDNVQLLIRTDTSNGASFDSGVSDYLNQKLSGAGSTAAAANSTSAFIVANQASVGNAANEGMAGFILLAFRGSASMYPLFLGVSCHLDPSTALEIDVMAGARASAAAIDAMQLFFSTGNIASGTVRIYGLRNS